MSKKVLSLMLSLVMILSVCLSGSADEIYGEGIYDEYNVLSTLGFVGEKEITDFSKTITRGEAAEYIARLFHENLGEPQQYFKDVPPESEYFEGVWILAKMGVISGDNGFFEPDRAVSATEAVKMIVSALGLDYIAQLKGGYPTGYMAVAQNKKIVSGLGSIGGDLSAGDLVHMLFKTLKSDVDASSAYDGEYQRGGETFLSKRFSIYESSGILTDNGTTTLLGKSSLKDGYIKIDSEMFLTNGDFYDLIGRKVKFYYKSEKGEEKELLYAYPAYIDDSIIITDEQDPVFSNYEYKYYADENSSKQKTVKLARNYALIYNNAAISEGAYFQNALMTPQMGTVELIDSNSDSLYDVVKIKDYKDVITAGADSGKQIIYDKNSGEPIDLGAADVKFSIKYEDGSAATFVAASAPDTLLTVLESADKKFYEIIIAIGAERGVYSMQKDDEITVGENIYKLSPYFTGTLTLGTEYDFYFNSFGKIAYVEETNTSADKLAYLIGLSTSKPLENPKAKIFTEDYGIMIASLANRVKVADGRTLEASAVATYLGAGGTGVKQIIRYRLNAKDEISVLMPLSANECVVENMSAKAYGRLSMITDATNTDGLTNPKQYPYDASVKVFTVGNTDNSFAVNGVDFFPEYISPVYTLSAYATNPAYPSLIDVIVIKSDGTSGGEYLDYNVDNSVLSSDHEGAHGVMVESINKVMVDGNIVSQVYVRSGSKRTYFTVEDDEALTFNGTSGRYVEGGRNDCTVEPGDIIKYGKNSNGAVPAGNLIVVYDENRDVYRDYVSNPWGNSYSYSTRTPWASFSLQRVYFYDKQKDFFTLYDTPITDPLPDEKHRLVRKLTGAAQIIVFDREKETISVGNINDLMTYKSVDTNCANGILYNYENTASGYKLYIYR